MRTCNRVSNFLQLTGALSHVLPIMISVMVSKWVADAFGKEGIYSVWIALRRYPWLPPVEYRDKGETAEGLMIPVERLVTIPGESCSLTELGQRFKRDFCLKAELRCSTVSQGQ